jgi:3'-5' exoribonuclease
MTAICELGQYVGQVVTGQYTLTRVEARTTQLGGRYKSVLLADHTGSLRSYAWENSGVVDDVPTRTPTTVAADLYVRRLHGEVIANVQSIRRLETYEVSNAAALLPWETCPVAARPALAKLVAFVADLQPDVLRQFMQRVLLDPRVASGLTTCKASQRNHHCQPGGLLTHSIEVLEIATDMVRSRLDPADCGIAQVAALLHDLGKLRAVGSGAVRPIHYLLASHESQTVRMLDLHLEWLRARAPELAAGLIYTLEYLAQPAATRGRAKFLVAQSVSAADRMSAALDDNKRLEDLVARTLPARRTKRPADQRSAHELRTAVWL